jgi:hypothetical protein
MQFDGVLRDFVLFLDDRQIDYGITGDLALHLCGYPRARPRLEFAVAAGAETEVNAYALQRGFVLIQRARRVAVYGREHWRVAVTYTVIPATLPFLFEGKVMKIIDPARRLPFDEEEIAALDTSTMNLTHDEVSHWLIFMSDLAPAPRQNAANDRPFVL